MTLSTAQADRAAGVLLGQGIGDALGVPYEFATPPAANELAQMLGGGLIDGAPGEWSDDTQMAVCIAEVAATGADLAGRDGLDAVAEGFLRWFAEHPKDIGVQTRAVLGEASRATGAPAARLTSAARGYAARHARSAGNGALMRTSVVALASLDDRAHTAAAARAVAELTHADRLAGDSCVLWTEAVRVAVLDGRVDVAAGLDLLPADRIDRWRAWLEEAQTGSARRFTPNGFTVTALQAAVAAVTGTPVPRTDPERGSYACLHLQDALHAAIRIGDDTDTVAAIAGGLLGARWGASAVPWQWRRLVHGWPGLRSRDLVGLATLATRGGRVDDLGWPSGDHVQYDDPGGAGVVPHPCDDQVLLGTARSSGHEATAVVSMCRVGGLDHAGIAPENRVESRLMDSDDPAANPNLHFVLRDVVDAVVGLRAEGHRVLLHCVAAQQRTPSAAVAYAVAGGHDGEEARQAVAAVLPSTRGHGVVWEAAARTGRPPGAEERFAERGFGPPPPRASTSGQ